MSNISNSNYFISEFLNIDAESDNNFIWIADRPFNFSKKNGEIIFNIPFNKFKCSKNEITLINLNDIVQTFCITKYNDNIIRFSLLNQNFKEKSEILNPEFNLTKDQLSFKKFNDNITIYDEHNFKIITFFTGRHPIKYWSDLIPAPQTEIEMEFFPDKNKLRLSSYDQFYPNFKNGLPLAFYIKEDGKIYYIIGFKKEINEKFAGTGERFSEINGKTIKLVNQDAQGVNTPRTYKNIPFFISNRKYGVFIHSSAHLKISFGHISSRTIQIVIEDNNLDIFIINGDDPEKILFNYRTLTGFPPLLPLWSFGVWMSKMTYFSEKEVNEVCDNLRKRQLPCDVIHLDTGWFKTDWLCEWKFNEERFPNPQLFFKNLKEKGFRVSLWQMPYISEKAEQYKEAIENKYIAGDPIEKRKDGSNFGVEGYAGTIDLTNPNAIKWYKNLLAKLLKMGASCIKADFGENIHMYANYYNGNSKTLQNLYALLYQKTVFEVTKEITGEGIIWARAGWAGCQRYPVHWGGDASCTWDGMADSLKGGLNLGISGFGYWSHDVPGFHGIPDFMNSVIDTKLYIRWTQFGVFTSHMRYHGTSNREPYNFPESEGIVRKWLNLRYSLIPYIIEQSKITSNSGYPILRSLIFQDCEDPVCWSIYDEYMFGNDFLVAPVMNENNIRDIYIPKGEWVNFFTGEKITGRQWLLNFYCPIEIMPVWVKFNSEIQIYPEIVQSTNEIDLNKSITLKIDHKFKGILYSTELSKIFKKKRDKHDE